MKNKIGKKIAAKLGDKIDFARSLFKQPKTVGAIAPTSKRMAKIMAGVANPDSNLPVLELGPGTGVITKAILNHGVDAERIISVEYSEGFLPGLNCRYPGVKFIHGDAFNITQIASDLGIDRFDCVISALPLLNFGKAQRFGLVDAALDLVDTGRPMVQFSYGQRPPVPAQPGNYSVIHIDTVLRNIPPAKIWTYQRA